MSGGPPQLRDQASVRTGLRIGGAIIAGTGLILVIAGFASFFSSMNSFSGPKHFWLAFIGIPLLGIGMMMLVAGFFGTTTRYAAGEVMPTVKDSLDYMGIGARRAALVTCPSCGHGNAPGSGFCSACGKPLPAA